MSELEEITTRLKWLGSQPATRETRQEVEKALSSKWEGVQSIAARVLSQWKGRDSVEALKDWLLRSYQKKRKWAIRTVAIEALTECYEEDDIPWILDLYFSRRDLCQQFELLWPLIVDLPVSKVYDRLLVECESSDRNSRMAALMAIGNMRESLLRKKEILERFTDDPDRQVRNYARTHLAGPQVPRKYRAWYFQEKQNCSE